MTTKTAITAKNFDSKLGSFVRTAKNQRETIQHFIEFGLTMAKEHGDLGYLSRFMVASVGVKSIPTRTIKDYKKEHANVKWVKTKDGSHTFKKDGKKLEVTEPETVWYEWKKAKHQAEVDQEKRALSMFKAYAKKLKDIGKSQEEVMDILNEVTAN